MKYNVTIPQWSDGNPLKIANVEAPDEATARSIVVAWVNQRAGYSYCSMLPLGTVVEVSRPPTQARAEGEETEPRGCPTPGACSCRASERSEAERRVIEAAREAAPQFDLLATEAVEINLRALKPIANVQAAKLAAQKLVYALAALPAGPARAEGEGT